MYNGGGGFLHSRFDAKRRKRGKAMSTVLLKNGIVYDGLGNPGVPGDVLIRDDRIEKVGNLGDAEADRVIDAAGRVICPGFVDIHRHCDAKPLNDPLFGKRELAQGITTTVVGNCGISLTPCPDTDAGAREMYDFDEAVLGPMELGLPRTYGFYLEAL